MASSNARPVFFYAPQTRALGVRVLLAELGAKPGADFELRTLDMKAGDLEGPGYRAVNPMGKVPAIAHAGAVVTEQAAVYMYLAEIFPTKGLGVAPGEPGRGDYLRWFVYYGSCFEPAILDKAMNRPAVPYGVSPWGDWDAVFSTLVAHLKASPYMAAGRFTALDVLWGSALQWMISFKILPEEAALTDYVARVTDRPSFREMTRLDEAAAAEQAARAT